MELALGVPELLNVAQPGEQRLGLIISVPAQSIRTVLEVSVLGVVGEDFPPANTDSGATGAAVTTGNDGVLHHQVVI